MWRKDSTVIAAAISLVITIVLYEIIAIFWYRAHPVKEKSPAKEEPPAAQTAITPSFAEEGDEEAMHAAINRKIIYLHYQQVSRSV